MWDYIVNNKVKVAIFVAVVVVVLGMAFDVPGHLEVFLP